MQASNVFVHTDVLSRVHIRRKNGEIVDLMLTSPSLNSFSLCLQYLLLFTSFVM